MADIELQLKRTKLSLATVLTHYGIKRSTYYGLLQEGDFEKTTRSRINLRSLLPEEEQAILDYRRHNRNVGYRKLTYMMNDADLVSASESAVHAVLKKHNLLGIARPESDPAAAEYRSKPKHPHHHWHIDIAYIKVRGVFYFLVMMLDGYSRYILDWEIMTDMLGSSVENFVQRVREQYPHYSPKMITDNGSQFVSRDFKQLVSRLDIQQVFTRRNHPQTNGKIERLKGTVKHEALRGNAPASFEGATALLRDYVQFYNNKRLHAGIGFLRPSDVFNRKALSILKGRRRRFKQAQALRVSINRERRECVFA